MGENQDVQYCKGQIITIILNMKDKMHNGKILLILSEIFNSFNSKRVTWKVKLVLAVAAIVISVLITYLRRLVY